MNSYKFDISDIEQYTSLLRAGDKVSISGYIYTARDSAHKRLAEMIENGEKLPFESIFSIYYAGPTPTKPGQIIGSCGPTTSSRMDKFSPLMMQNGMRAMIGKGKRSEDVCRAMSEHKCVYLVAIGGAGAVVSDNVKSLEVVCFEDLGCESIKKLYVENFETIVATDIFGNTMYK